MTTRGNVPHKRNPLYQGNKVLAFDNLSEEELKRLTNSQQSDRFISEWMSTIRPFSRYKRYFSGYKGDEDSVLSMIKTLYISYTCMGNWSDNKYALCLDHVFNNGLKITKFSMDKAGELYEEERLEPQIAAKRAALRSGRRKI